MNQINNYLNKCLLCNCEEELLNIPDNSIDVILADPPYLYLKHELDEKFDEHLVFNQYKRVLKDSGFIVMFGRGKSFYRWNSMLADLGFKFLEEIIWSKKYSSSPLLPISRVHETIAIFSMNGHIKKVKVPYIEMKQYNIESIAMDMKRIKSAIGSVNELSAIKDFLKSGNIGFCDDKKRKYNITAQGVIKEQKRGVKTLQAITNGMNEKSIIEVQRDHYNTIHPTQKPVKLLIRLLNLVSDEDVIVLDTFAGSMSTAEACYVTGRKFICFEKKPKFYFPGKERIDKLLSQGKYFKGDNNND